MRIAPLVFYLAGKPETERYRITKAVSSITHAHEWSVVACLIYLEYLLKILSGADKRDAYFDLRMDFKQNYPPSHTMYISSAALAKFDRILRSDISALPESAIKSGGFVIDTLEAVFWCFLTTENYHDAVLKAVNLGDDTDTTAAVTGALAGLFYGIDDIPAEWLETLAGCGDIRRLAGAMAEALSA
jgi:ADP-ribosylglycohydrolase